MNQLHACTFGLFLLGIGCSRPTPPTPTPKAAERPAPAAAAPDEPQAVAIEELFRLPADDGSGTKLTLQEIEAFLADEENHREVVPIAPFGLPNLDDFIPADNPMTRAKVELGRLLYFDPRLSRDGTVACVSCHDPDKGWAELTPVSTGIDGQQGGRSAPSVINRAFGVTQFWDGRAASLEEQSLGPIQNPIEMNFTLAEAVERLGGIEGYRVFFEKVFGGVSPEAIAKAIASFERTVLVGGAPEDYYAKAKPALDLSPEDLAELDPQERARIEESLALHETHPLGAAALRGRELYFGKAKCSLCHVGYNLSDETFYNIGVGMEKEEPDPGRKAVTGKEEDTGAFRTTSLRNIALYPPYMHDGSKKTLREVVQYYAKGGHSNPWLHQRIGKLDLTESEIDDLVAYLESGITGPLPPIDRPRLP